MRFYIGLTHKDEGSDYGVSFPDFPGCVGAGRSLDDARAMAEEALAFHVEGMMEDGETLPEPSTLDAIMADPENRDGVAMLVPLRVAGTVSVTADVPEGLIRSLDRFAAARGLDRSDALARAAAERLETEPG